MSYEPLSTQPGQTGTGGQGGYVPLSSSPANTTPKFPAGAPANIGTQTWNGQQIPADIPTKYLAGYDPTTDIRSFQLPDGGVYAQDKNNNIVNTPRNDDALGLGPAQKGSERDHIIPVSLGGTSQPGNGKLVPMSIASQQDTLEKANATKVRQGTNPKSLIAETLQSKEDIANQPSFGQKIGNFFKNTVEGIKKYIAPVAQDVAQKIGTDFKNVPTIFSDQGKKVFQDAYVVPASSSTFDKVKSSIDTLANLPTATANSLIVKPVLDSLSTLSELAYKGGPTGQGIKFTIPSSLLGPSFGKSGLTQGVTIQDAQSVYADAINAGETPQIAMARSIAKAVGDTAFGVTMGLGIMKAGLMGLSPESLVKVTQETNTVLSEAATGVPVPEQLRQTFENLPPDDQIKFVKNLIDAMPKPEPSLLGKALGVTQEEAQRLFDESQFKRSAQSSSIVPHEPIQTTIHPSTIVPQEGLVKENFLQNIPELAKSVAPPIAPITPKSAPGEAIVPKATSWSELQKTNPELWNTGILRKSQSPMGAEGVIPADVHSAQAKWQNYGQDSEVSADILYERVNSGYAKGDYVDSQGFPVRDSNGNILRDTYDEATGEYIKPTVPNEQLKNNLLEQFKTPEGKKYLGEVINALPKNTDGTITAYRIGSTGEGVQSYTLSEGMAKTFSHQGTDIPIPGTPGLPAGGYKDFGALPANMVRIDPKGIKAWSPYDAEILVDSKSVSKFITPKVSESPLTTEARKYKSAEEFVKAQEPIYHGTPEKFSKFDTSKSEGNATWFTHDIKDITDNTAGAVQAKGQKLNVMERYLKPDIKLATPEMADKMYTDQLISEGYRGVKYPKGEYGDYTWTKLFNPNEDTVTKSQLTDFYNQATKGQPESKVNLPEVNKPKDTSVTLASGFNPGVDKFIAEDVKPAIEKTKEVGSIIGKTAKRIAEAIRGVLNADAPVRKNIGGTAYSDVIRAVHLPEAERITFDNNFNETEKWFDQFTDKQLKDFNLSRGTPATPEAKALQEKAQASLPVELQSPEVTKAIKQASDYVFSLATDAGLDLKYFEDYFRGVYKDPGKVADFLDYWRSTENYTKEKTFPSIADASSFGLELKDPNPIRNIRSELEAVTKRVGLKQLRDKLEANSLNKTFAISTEEATALQKQEWSPIHDPVFNGMLFDPSYARLVDNLISTNKVSQNLFTKGLKQLNQLVMQVKFTGSLFHLGNELKAAVSQEAFGVADPRGYVDFMKSFKPIDTTSPVYKDYVNLGGGHSYSLEAQAQNQLNVGLRRLMGGNYLGGGTRLAVGTAKLPVEVTKWMFEKFIPKLKFEKFSQDVALYEDKLGRPLTDAEKISIIKRNQNFYGEMNERLFGRSGTATSAMRLFFQAPGYGEGNFRALGAGFSDPKSARFVFHSLLTTLVLAVVATKILTGKWPNAPKKMRDIRDLFKVMSNQKDGNGDTIYYDAMTYDKDYWSIMGNVLTGQFSNVGTDLTTRFSGSIGGLPKAMTDTAAIIEGKIVVDWKGTPIYNATDTTPQKMQKYLNYEFGSLTPISVSGFQQSRQKGQSLLSSATTAIAGVRATTSEEVKHLKAIRNDLFTLQTVKKQEQIRLNTLASTNLQEAQKEAHDFNATQMTKLKALFKEYPNSNITKSLYFLESLKPKSKTSGGTTSKSILGQ